MEDGSWIVQKLPIQQRAFELQEKRPFPEWLSEAIRDGRVVRCDKSCVSDETTFLIQTLEGSLRARLGDWILEGVAGELYPCEREIFKRTYVILQPCFGIKQ